VKLVTLTKGEKLQAIARVMPDDEEESDEEGGTENDEPSSEAEES
jgi:hypothetical protein